MATTTPIEIRAVIFDMDGTLLDTETLSQKAIQMVLSGFDCAPMDWELQRKLLGLRGSDWSKIVVAERGLEGKLDPEYLVQQWGINLHELVKESVKMEGVMDVITKLREMNVLISVATSSYRDAFDNKKTYHEDMLGNMDVVVCGDDPEVCFYIVPTTTYDVIVI